MNSEIYAATQGLVARQLQLDVIANNLANANTTGFRETKPFFHTFNQAIEEGPLNPLNGAANNQPVLSGNFHKPVEGALRHTASPLDFALRGDGYFKLDTPFGQRYTRNGHFQLASNGDLVTAQGYQVLDSNGRNINLSGGAITSDKEGNLSVDGIQRAKLGVVNLTDPNGLVPEEDNLFANIGAQNPETPYRGSVNQGFLESSNVNVAEQMILMIEAHRAYESNIRLIRTVDQDMNRASIQTLGSSR